MSGGVGVGKFLERCVGLGENGNVEYLALARGPRARSFEPFSPVLGQAQRAIRSRQSSVSSLY